MDKRFKIPHGLLSQVSYNNTANGGTAVTVVRKHITNSYIKFKVSVPTVAAAEIKIKVTERYCKVYRNVFDVISGVDVCHILAIIPFSGNIDSKLVTAEAVKGDIVVITAPFYVQNIN